MAVATAKERLTVRVSNIPKSATAKDLLELFESFIGKGTVYACDIARERNNWKSRGFGRVQFETLDAKTTATRLFHEGNLVFSSSILSLYSSFDDVVVRPTDCFNRIGGGTLHSGVLERDDCMCVVESWRDGVKASVMPERSIIEFFICNNNNNNEDVYKLEIPFDYVFESSACSLEDASTNTPNALLLKLKYAPRIFKKISGPNVNSKLSENRYFICKEDYGFVWVRTTDFSSVNSIGLCTSLCFEFNQGQAALEVFTGLPYFKKDVDNLVLEEEVELNSTTSGLVPLVKCPSDCKLSYEILFQLCSLIHTHKISLASVDDDLIDLLTSLDVDIAMLIIQKLHKRHSACYDPVQFIKIRQHILTANTSKNNLPSSSLSRLTNQNMMRCHRVLVTPTKLYCLGPELETSNYVVKHFASYASDFMRVTFVEEDWSKLPATAVSTTIQQGIFGKPYRTDIHNRILSVLRDGIEIGSKRFQFLAFSASQLRSNAVWMFASNEKVRAEDIREWMGCFNKIRSVSKCAARMGQLFSASTQTFDVLSQEVEIIPDIEVTTDGVSYCFSDGIGKISPSFARQVADACGLESKPTPSAFQIRYGGYKGIVAVDRNSYRKLSLRRSMLKFDSKSRMLNVTKWSDSMPCFLNREIITLLSTLGVEDSVFEAMQEQQLVLLSKMLTSKEAALNVLESLAGNDAKYILGKMLVHGYEPNAEPYLNMMLKAHHDNLLHDLKVRCRINVPKGRILIGCLDEMGILEYGQVYARITMTKRELLECKGKSCFQKVDGTTSVVSGKVVVTKNPCLHPGDVRVLEAVCEVALVEKGLVDCIVFPHKGKRPHPNECSGGDLDGDLYFISWDEDLIPSHTVAPMDYSGRRSRIMDHDVTLEEIHKFFVDYMVSDTLGIISTAHLIHADREPTKALSEKCLQLANLHSMAVDFAKTGAPAEMPNFLKPKEFPDFMERGEKSSYISNGVLGKLYRAIMSSSSYQKKLNLVVGVNWEEAYDVDLVVEGFEDFVGIAKNHKEMYCDKMTSLMNFYGAKTEEEILSGNLRNRSSYLVRDNRKYTEMRERMVVSVKSLYKEAKGWFKGSCNQAHEKQKLASAWYHVTYHPTYYYSHESSSLHCLGFPWIMGDVLLSIKSSSTTTTLPQ